MRKSNILFRGVSLIEVSIILSVSAFVMMSLSYFFTQKSELDCSQAVVAQYNILKNATIKYISEQVGNEIDVTNKAFEVTIDELKVGGYLPSKFNQQDGLFQKMSVWIRQRKNYVEGYIIISGGENVDLVSLKRTALLIGPHGGFVNDKGDFSINGGWLTGNIRDLDLIGIKAEKNKNIIIFKESKTTIKNNQVKFEFHDDGTALGRRVFRHSYFLNGGNQNREARWPAFYSSDNIKFSWSGENVSYYKMSITVGSKSLLSDIYFSAKSKEYTLYPAIDWVGKKIALTFRAYKGDGSVVASVTRGYEVYRPSVVLSVTANIASFPVNKVGLIESAGCVEKETPVVSVLNSLSINANNDSIKGELLNPIVFNLIRKDSLNRKDIMYSGVMNSESYINNDLQPKFGLLYAKTWSRDMSTRSSIHQSCSSDSLFVVEWRYVNYQTIDPYTTNVKLVNY